MSTTTTPVKFNEIICIGLGLSGVCLGVQLKRKLGFTDMQFYDRNSSHSGTWWTNHYPGAACDIPAIFYSYSFEMNPNWSCLLPSHEEIHKYLEGVVDKYMMRPHMKFSTECESAKWDDKRQIWTVHLQDLGTGARYVHECRLLFSAVGVLVEPKDLGIPGTQNFEGPMFHTARWRHDINLEDKDIIVIGNGCSATQMVPKIAPMARTLTQFIHTPHWLQGLSNTKFGPGTQWAFRNIPILGRFVRLVIFIWAESLRRMFYMDKRGARMRRATEKQATQYILGTAPEQYHDMLIPDWEISCKRRIFDVDGAYLKTLHAPNMHLTKDPILEIVPRGVRTATKTYPADVIVLANGFQTHNRLGPLRIQGRDGEWLNDHWRNMGGPGAYNGTAMRGFPNFLMIHGPNSTPGNSSVILASENMVNYALRVIEPVIRGEASELEIEADAEREYLRRVQTASSQQIFATCHNWYTNNGWNSVLYPWSQLHLWWRSTFPTWRDWDYKYTARRGRTFGLRGILLTLLSILSLTNVLVSWNGVQWWSTLADSVFKSE